MKIIKIFVSSPCDVEKEREIVDQIARQINITDGDRWGFRYETFRWEEKVVPRIGPPPQDTINQQAPFCEVYLGILSSRFGTSTEGWGSGTEAEFRNALRDFGKVGKPWILFYFDEAPPEAEGRAAKLESRKIERFREELESMGLYSTYRGVHGGPDSFQQKVDRHLRGLIELISDDEDKGGTPRPRWVGSLALLLLVALGAALSALWGWEALRVLSEGVIAGVLLAGFLVVLAYLLKPDKKPWSRPVQQLETWLQKGKGLVTWVVGVTFLVLGFALFCFLGYFATDQLSDSLPLPASDPQVCRAQAASVLGVDLEAGGCIAFYNDVRDLLKRSDGWSTAIPIYYCALAPSRALVRILRQLFVYFLVLAAVFAFRAIRTVPQEEAVGPSFAVGRTGALVFLLACVLLAWGSYDRWELNNHKYFRSVFQEAAKAQFTPADD